VPERARLRVDRQPAKAAPQPATTSGKGGSYLGPVGLQSGPDPLPGLDYVSTELRDVTTAGPAGDVRHRSEMG
jgi:hypothetical protein